MNSSSLYYEYIYNKYFILFFNLIYLYLIMKNNLNQTPSQNDYMADEVLKPLPEYTKLPQKFEDKSKIEEENKVDLKPLKLFKTYELNDEGLRLYGIYKKQQHLTIFKWSFLGTAFGCLFAFIIDVSFKKMSFTKKDYLKTLFLFGSIGLCTFYGVQISTYRFKLKQLELSQKYGKEIEETSDENNSDS
jgi:hypothetical protein